MLQRIGSRSVITRPSTIGTVGVSAVGIVTYALVRFHPNPQVPDLAPDPEPPTIPDTAPRPGDPGLLGSRVGAEAAAQLDVGDSLFKQAGAESSVLCRAALFCDALEVYGMARQTLELIESCDPNCDSNKARAASRQAYIERQLPLLADSLGCAAGAEFCACVRLAGGSDCR